MAIAPWYAPGSGRRSAISRNRWDVVTFAGEDMPGRSKIAQASVSWKVDEKKASGKDADRVSKLGFESRPLAFEVEVVNVAEMEAVDRILAPYIPRPGGEMNPATIDHPSLHHMVGFFAVTIREVPQWERDGARCRLRVNCATWVATEKPAAGGADTKVQTPNKLKVRNKRREDAQRRGNTGGSNPAPASQPGFCGPSFSAGTP